MTGQLNANNDNETIETDQDQEFGKDVEEDDQPAETA
jgi:hypothetical protein